MLSDTFASQDWRTKCMLDLSLNEVIITPVTGDPKFLPVYHRMADVLARFRCSLGCLRDTDCHCCFGGGGVLYLVPASNW